LQAFELTQALSVPYKLPYSEEEDKEIAKATDLAYFNAVERGEVSRTGQMKGKPRNAGSRRPEDITAYGAELPPGGGGGKFGRIVSGSYDESIIIWRRDKEGVWRAQHTLRQDEGGVGRVRRPAQAQAHNNAHPPAAAAAAIAAAVNPGPTAPAPAPAPTASTAPSMPSIPPSLPDVDAPTTPFAPGSESYWNHVIDSAIATTPLQLRTVLQAHPQLLDSEHLDDAVAALPANVRAAYVKEINDLTGELHQQSLAGHGAGSGDSANFANTPGPSTQTTQAGTLPQQPPTSTPQTTTHTLQTITQGPIVQAPATIPPPATQVAPSAAPASIQAAAPGAPAPHPPHNRDHNHGSMARVFKLQFDARRIICCSQTSVIVGWDFANGDEQILEASRFFAPIE